MANAIRFSEAYLTGLDAAIANYWLVSQAATERFAEDHDRVTERIREFPGSGQRVSTGRYTVPIADSGYRIIYRVQHETVTLLRLENVRRRRK